MAIFLIKKIEVKKYIFENNHVVDSKIKFMKGGLQLNLNLDSGRVILSSIFTVKKKL